MFSEFTFNDTGRQESRVKESKAGLTLRVFKKSFRIVLVRLYDSQDELKTGARKKTCPEFYIINPNTSSDCELHCTQDRNVGYHEKYIKNSFI